MTGLTGASALRRPRDAEEATAPSSFHLSLPSVVCRSHACPVVRPLASLLPPRTGAPASPTPTFLVHGTCRRLPQEAGANDQCSLIQFSPLGYNFCPQEPSAESCDSRLQPASDEVFLSPAVIYLLPSRAPALYPQDFSLNLQCTFLKPALSNFVSDLNFVIELFKQQRTDDTPCRAEPKDRASKEVSKHKKISLTSYVIIELQTK